jgi:hypothetical protein
MRRAAPATPPESHGPSSSREKAEAYPLACPACGGDISLIAFITDPQPLNHPHDGRTRGVSAHSLKIAPASRFIRVWPSDVGHNHWISDGPTPGQRLPFTIESIAEPPLTVLSFPHDAGSRRT